MCAPNTHGHASLSQWEIREVYDRASECKETRDNNTRTAFDHALQNLHKYGKSSQLDQNEIAEQKACQCIASDDPRLKP